MKANLKVLFVGLLIVFIAVILIKQRNDMQQIHFVNNMGVGINIGNSLDSTLLKGCVQNETVFDYETFWNNPVNTRQLYQTIKSCGFGTVRIPVTWDEHIDENGVIDDAWMGRVKEVVKFALEADLYVILNTHHESWIIPTPENEQACSERLIKVWQQIAEEFSETGQKLLFEGMNEPRLVSSQWEWTAGTQEMRRVVNRLNTDFIKTVRESGGENAERYLLIGGYGTSYHQEALLDLSIPNDNKIIVSVHAYLPYEFALGNQQDFDLNSQADTKELSQLMTFLNRHFIKRNIPVIISEFACGEKETMEEQLAWTRFYTQNATANGISYIWWDNGADFKLIDRREYYVTNKEQVEVLLGAS